MKFDFEDDDFRWAREDERSSITTREVSSEQARSGAFSLKLANVVVMPMVIDHHIRARGVLCAKTHMDRRGKTVRASVFIEGSPPDSVHTCRAGVLYPDPVIYPAVVPGPDRFVATARWTDLSFTLTDPRASRTSGVYVECLLDGGAGWSGAMYVDDVSIAD